MLQNAYIIREDEGVRRVLDETYDDLLAAVRFRHPGAESLLDDEELSQLHDLLACLRLGAIRLSYAEDAAGRMMILQIGGG